MTPRIHSATEQIPHDEYYFYVMDNNDEPRCLHLTTEIVSDMREMIELEFPSSAGNWSKTVSFNLGDGIWFEFKPDKPTNSRFVFKPAFGSNEQIFGSTFKEQVWFDTSFLSASTGPPADKYQHHYKKFRDEVIQKESHSEKYQQKLFVWEESGGWKTDWMDW